MAADIEVHMVAHMEVDKVADMAKLRVPNLARRRRKGTQFGERIGQMGWLVNWAQTISTPSLPNLRVFFAS